MFKLEHNKTKHIQLYKHFPPFFQLIENLMKKKSFINKLVFNEKKISRYKWHKRKTTNSKKQKSYVKRNKDY